MKKVLSFLAIAIVLMALVVCFLLPAKAATEGYYTYTVSDGKATITDVDTSISGDITIPSTLAGNPITSIGNSAFEYCFYVTNITIPDSVSIIGDRAFRACSQLKSVEISKSVTNIGDSAFESSGLTSITIPDNVKTIGRNAFAGATNLTSVVIENGITEISYGAFVNCVGLKTITIPSGVTNIGDMAFYGAYLETVYYDGTQSEWEKITIGANNTHLLEAELITKKDPIEEAIAGTALTTGVVDGETVIIVPTSKNDVAMTEDKLSAIFNDETITITSNNGIIGTGCKITIGEYEVVLVVKGDIDGDGVVTVFDALMLKKALANNGFENEALREFAGDVDGVDGTTEADVSAILSYIVGKSFINNSESIELAACYSGNSISDTSLSVITLTYLNENKYDVAIRSYTSQFTGNAREPIVVNGITYSYLGGGSTPDAEYTINNDNTITFTIPGFFTATYELQQNNLHRISYDGNDFFPEVFEVA